MLEQLDGKTTCPKCWVCCACEELGPFSSIFPSKRGRERRGKPSGIRMPSFEAAVPHNRASTTSTTTADQLQRPQSRKDSMEPGTESMLWHMMNDMHRAIDVDNSQLHDEKHGNQEEKIVGCMRDIIHSCSLLLSQLSVTNRPWVSHEARQTEKALLPNAGCHWGRVSAGGADRYMRQSDWCGTPKLISYTALGPVTIVVSEMKK